MYLGLQPRGFMIVAKVYGIKIFQGLFEEDKF
jgi:hypothetical protein